jgi:4-amino-4-deoxy-L-arabinose transferase-like glycosyltransferase
MLHTGNWLVPHINGNLYGHKPPLMFWLFDAGWLAFGVNDWWPRIVLAAFAFGGLVLTSRIATLLWPQRPQIAAFAPLMAGGSLLWVAFTGLVMFDLMLSFFVLLALLGLLRAGLADDRRGWILCGLAMGLGGLAKGPVILLHVLPLALLAPWWLPADRRPAWKHWYGRIALAVGLAFLVALAWAIPASIVGGAEFREEIFWRQSANRMVQSFAHRQPFWWYLPLLPLLLFPWSVWPPVWRGLKFLRGELDSGARICLAWAFPVLLGFSFISGKQVHYLLPIFPAVALLFARGLDDRSDHAAPRWHAFVIALGVVSLSVVLWMLTIRYRHPLISPDDFPTLRIAAAATLALGFAILWLKPRRRLHAVALLGTAMVLLSGILHIGLVRSIIEGYDLTPVSRHLAGLQQRGIPIAHIGKYHAQFQFLGRLQEPLQPITTATIAAWTEKNPQGRIVTYVRPGAPLLKLDAEFSQTYRGQTVLVFPAADLLAKTRGLRDSETGGIAIDAGEEN